MHVANMRISVHTMSYNTHIYLHAVKSNKVATIHKLTCLRDNSSVVDHFPLMHIERVGEASNSIVESGLCQFLQLLFPKIAIILYIHVHKYTYIHVYIHVCMR